MFAPFQHGWEGACHKGSLSKSFFLQQCRHILFKQICRHCCHGWELSLQKVFQGTIEGFTGFNIGQV